MPNRYFSIRAGQIHWLQEVGIGGLDRRYKHKPGYALFSFGLGQNGIELAYVFGPGWFLNGVDPTSTEENGHPCEWHQPYIDEFGYLKTIRCISPHSPLI
jgi:hypothetical protein